MIVEIQFNMRKIKIIDRSERNIQQQGYQKQLKEINQSLNRFLKLHFTIEIGSLQQYLHNVKDLLIQLTTKQMSPIITNVFSKFSNILQPFTSYSYDLSLDSLKQQITLLRESNCKLKTNISRMKVQLEDYRVKGNKMTEFIHLLRVNNIDVDQIFRRGLMGKKTVIINQEIQEQSPERRGVELRTQQLLHGLVQQSSLSSQYVSIKSKR